MQSVQNLLVLYIVLLLFNVLLTGALWMRQRTLLHRDLFRVWGACTLSFVGQGALQHGNFAITVGFGVTFLATIALSSLLARLAGEVFSWRAYGGGMAAALALSALSARLDLDFVFVALPVAVAVAAPLLVTTVRRIRLDWAETPVSGRALLVTCLLFVGHNLDFPFLRDKPEFAPFGFTLAVLIVFGLAITSNALVLERVAAERTRIAELGRIRNQFFANISHELRTPLTLILGPVESLLEANLEQATREPLSAVRRSALRLLRMIDDLLDLAMLESGSLRLDVGSVDLPAVARKVYEMAGTAAEARGVALELVVERAEQSVYGDSHRLEIILTNLVGNALKYTPAGGHVEIRVRVDEEGALVRVTDDGPGIAPESTERIFERFVQVDGSATRSVGGVGIGLSFARELAELHGGSLEVESVPGHGASFELRLKSGQEHLGGELVEERRAPSEERSDRRVGDLAEGLSRLASDGVGSDASSRSAGDRVRLEGGRSPRVLIVEDEPELRAYIVGLLRTEYETVAVGDGAAALEALEGRRFDLVVTDVMMPRLSGVELCREIKSRGTLGAPPVVLLTARSGTEAALEGYEAGADDFVAKPFHPRVLQARIRAQLKVRQLGMQLAEQGRLVSAGRLAAGVAHEIRNPLNAIANAASIIESGGSSKVPDDELFELILLGVERIDQVVSALDEHVRPADGEGVSVCDVTKGIESTLCLMAHRMESIEVHRDYRGHGAVLAPARAFNQVIQNLIDNAIRSGAGQIWLSMAKSDGDLELSVADDGPGVPSDVMAQIFDPFFTTRVEGQGTGLGLYLSRRLARDCGGELRFEERAGGGARFVLRLPVVDSGRDRG